MAHVASVSRRSGNSPASGRCLQVPTPFGGSLLRFVRVLIPLFFLLLIPFLHAQTCSPTGSSPSVTICSPTANSTVSSPVTITAAAQSTETVQFSQIYIDGVKKYQVNGANVNTQLSMSSGQHRVTVQAYDGTYFKQVEYITVSGSSSGCTLNTADPSVTICQPQNNATVDSPVHIVAGTTSSKSVSFIQIYVDGVKAYQAVGAKLDTTVSMASGTRRVTVQAYNGAYFKQTINITVSGTTPPPSGDQSSFTYKFNNMRTG